MSSTRRGRTQLAVRGRQPASPHDGRRIQVSRPRSVIPNRVSQSSTSSLDPYARSASTAHPGPLSRASYASLASGPRVSSPLAFNTRLISFKSPVLLPDGRLRPKRIRGVALASTTTVRFGARAVERSCKGRGLWLMRNRNAELQSRYSSQRSASMKTSDRVTPFSGSGK